MKTNYTATVKLDYGNSEKYIDKSFETANEAYTFCQKCANYFGIDFKNCYILNSWADQIYSRTNAGQKFFVEFKEKMHEVSEMTFRTVYGVE